MIASAESQATRFPVPFPAGGNLPARPPDCLAGCLTVLSRPTLLSKVGKEDEEQVTGLRAAGAGEAVKGIRFPPQNGRFPGLPARCPHTPPPTRNTAPGS